MLRKYYQLSEVEEAFLLEEIGPLESALLELVLESELLLWLGLSALAAFLYESLR